MQKSGIFKHEFMPRKNVGFFASVIWLFISILCISPSIAASTCIANSSCTAGQTQITVGDLQTQAGCATWTQHRWGTECVKVCTACKSGYNRSTYNYTNSSCTNSLSTVKCEKAATECTATTYSSTQCGSIPAYSLGDCQRSTKKCFGSSYVQTCIQCNSGTLTSATYTPISGDCPNSYSYKYCKSGSGPIVNPEIGQGEVCMNDAGCTTYVGKTETSCGIANTKGECINGKCNYLTTYGCDEGCYIKPGGIDTNGYTGPGECARCPTHPDGGSVSSPGVSGNYPNTINACFVIAGQTHTDSSGSYTFTEDCNYEGGSGSLPSIPL